MTVYLGKNPVGVGRIVEKKVAKEKFGATVDTFLGDVDADGNYVFPSEPSQVNLTGVKHIPSFGLYYKFYRSAIRRLVANEVVSVAEYGFYGAASSSDIEELRFDNLEEITSLYAMYRAIYGCTKKVKVLFPKLKRISADNAFTEFNYNSDTYFDVEQAFPALEEISGSAVFGYFITMGNAYKKPLIFPSVKKITGGNSTLYATFRGYANDLIYCFPNAVELTGYIWNMSSSYGGEIHFAAANQAAIEACAGYATKWGYTGATIYFDL